MTISSLADKMSVSSRTIRYDLDLLACWFRDKKVPLIKKSNVGIYLDRTVPDFAQLCEYFKRPAIEQQVYSANERKFIMAIKILEGNRVYTISRLAAFANVSKSTAAKDLKDVEARLRDFHIKLVKKPNFGIEARGSEIDIRGALADQLLRNYRRISLLQILYRQELTSSDDIRRLNRINDFWDAMPIERIRSFLKNIQKTLHIVFTDEHEAELFAFLSAGAKRFEAGNVVKIDGEQLKKIKGYEEYKIVAAMIGELFGNQDKDSMGDEDAYVTMHILGTGINRLESSGGKFHEGLKKARSAIKKFINAVAAETGVDIRSDKELLNDLLLEIKPLVMRAQFDIKTESDKKLFMDQYPSEYYAVINSSYILEQRFSVKINDALLTNVAFHIAAAIERKIQNRLERLFYAVVVCGAGIGTAKLLSSRITSVFPKIKISAQLSLGEYQNFDDSDIDFVFTTIPLQGREGDIIIEVTPLLSGEDIRKIQEHVYTVPEKEHKAKGQMQRALKIIERYCTVNDRKGLVSDLEKILLIKTETDRHLELTGPSLDTLVTGKMVAVNVKASDYADAIRRGGKLLFDNKSIDHRYIEEMQKTAQTYMGNIVIAPHIAMPHARPQGYVNRVCMSIVHLKNPVCFGHREYDPVKIVFCLGAVDDCSHHRALDDLLALLEDKAAIDRVLNAEKAEDILLAIKHITRRQRRF
jgi:transcriptional antiterminator/mannitol/fructose-specific phosphotransferase system IIA component (Ntr-type)